MLLKLKKNRYPLLIFSAIVLCFFCILSYTYASSNMTYYFNKAQNIKLKDKYGYTKISVNGKNIKIKAAIKTKTIKCTSGKYVIKTTNKKNTKKTITIYIDKKKPTVKGVRNLASYEKATIKVSDNIKLQEVRLDGSKKGTSFQVTKEGTHTVTAKDKAGNKTTVTFIIRKKQVTNPTTPSNTITPVPISTQGAEIVVYPTITPGNVLTEPTEIIPTVVPTIPVQIGPTLLPDAGIPSTNVTPVPTTPVQIGPTLLPDAGTPSVNVTPVPTMPVQIIPTPIPSTPIPPVIITPVPTQGVQICKEHQWELEKDNKENHEATCTENGLHIYLCKICGAVKREELKAQGHEWEINVSNETSKVSSADCENAAVYHYTCKKCNETSKETTIYGKPTGHNYVDELVDEKEQIVTPATCTNGAIYKKVCKNENCPNKYSNDTWQKDKNLGHDYQIPETKPAPLCETKEYPYLCTRCNKSSPSKTYKVDGKGHNWTTENPSNSHCDEATCTEPKYFYMYCPDCKIYSDSCSDSESWKKKYPSGETLGHSFTVKDEHNAYKKNWADCCHNKTYYYRCERCAESSENHGGISWEQENTMLNHSLVTEKNPTCTEKGIKGCQNTLYDGSKCQYKEDIMANGHNFVTKVDDEKYLLYPADCNNNKKLYYKCENCNESSKNKTDKDKGYEWWEVWNTRLSHNYSIIAKEPTCTEKGLKKCSNKKYDGSMCDATQAIGALGHNFTQDIVLSNYSNRLIGYCTDAKYGKVCSRTGCNAYSTVLFFYSTSGCFGHDFSVQDTSSNYKLKDATYSEPEYYYYKCSRKDHDGHDCTVKGPIYSYGSRIDTSPASVNVDISCGQIYRKNNIIYVSGSSDTKVKFNVTSNDDYGISKVSCSLSEHGVQNLLENGKAKTFNETIEYSLFHSGDYTFFITVTDVGGNQTSETINFRYSLNLPDVDI